MNTDLRCVLAQKLSFPLVKDLSMFLLLGRFARVREVRVLCDLVVFLSVGREKRCCREKVRISCFCCGCPHSRSLAPALCPSPLGFKF